MKLQTLGNSVILRKLPERNTTEPGIVLLGDGLVKTHPDAIVISAPQNSPFKDGDKVKYTRGAELNIEIESSIITLVKEQDILSK
jgi:co-chaperonin GroES (HSP10)